MLSPQCCPLKEGSNGTVSGKVAGFLERTEILLKKKEQNPPKNLKCGGLNCLLIFTARERRMSFPFETESCQENMP